MTAFPTAVHDVALNLRRTFSARRRPVSKGKMKTFTVRSVRWLPLVAAIGLAAMPATASASTVPDRSTTTNADTGGAAIAALGCDVGAIHGFARVKGTLANMPANAYTSSTTYVDTRYNCMGGVAYVRRQSTGLYYVRFVGVPSTLAIAQNNADGLDPESTNNDNVLTVSRVIDNLDGVASFRVEVQDVCGEVGCSSGADPQNGQFTIMLI